MTEKKYYTIISSCKRCPFWKKCILFEVKNIGIDKDCPLKDHIKPKLSKEVEGETKEYSVKRTF